MLMFSSWSIFHRPSVSHPLIHSIHDLLNTYYMPDNRAMECWSDLRDFPDLPFTWSVAVSKV